MKDNRLTGKETCAFLAFVLSLIGFASIWGCMGFGVMSLIWAILFFIAACFREEDE